MPCASRDNGLRDACRDVKPGQAAALAASGVVETALGCRRRPAVRLSPSDPFGIAGRAAILRAEARVNQRVRLAAGTRRLTNVSVGRAIRR